MTVQASQTLTDAELASLIDSLQVEIASSAASQEMNGGAADTTDGCTGACTPLTHDCLTIVHI